MSRPNSPADPAGSAAFCYADSADRIPPPDAEYITITIYLSVKQNRAEETSAAYERINDAV